MEHARRKRAETLEAIKAKAQIQRERAAAAAARLRSKRLSLQRRLERRMASWKARSALKVADSPAMMGGIPQPRDLLQRLNSLASGGPKVAGALPAKHHPPATPPRPVTAERRGAPVTPPPSLLAVLEHARATAKAFKRLSLPMYGDTTASSGPDHGLGPTALLDVVQGGPEKDSPSTRLLARASVPFDRLTDLLSASTTLQATARLLTALARLQKHMDISSVPNRPPRVFLAAYPMVEHPEIVLSGTGTLERPLLDAGRAMLGTVEDLVALLLRTKPLDDEPSSVFESSLRAFASAWATFAERFREWRAADAASLETELIRMAVALQSSARRKLDDSLRSGNRRHSPPDMDALVTALEEDLGLLRKKIGRLTGEAGLRRLEEALAAVGVQAETRCSSGGDNDGTISDQQGSSNDDTSVINKVDLATVVAAKPNLPLMWHLLRDPRWRLPVQSAEASRRLAMGSVTGDMTDCEETEESRIQRVAELAFWDAVAARLEQAAGMELVNEVRSQRCGLENTMSTRDGLISRQLL